MSTASTVADVLDQDNPLKTTYQQFIHLSKYSRWLEKENRRETWRETVWRYINFWKGRNLIDEALGDYLFDHIYNLHTMPSMRCLMTAGPALDRDEIAGYNCAYTALGDGGKEIELTHPELDVPIKMHLVKPTDFDEIFYVLMCGTGVGFSVERQFINQLPKVGGTLNRSTYLPTEENFPGLAPSDLSMFDPDKNNIYVRDSKYGWASALRILIIELYNGNFDITWDVSEVRPAGARLKVFGGRASGPEPLLRLFEFSKALFINAKGRRLNSIECHSLVCKIADIVVVGSVRRSALISLSNLSDDRMRHAKSGSWYSVEATKHFNLANNSVCYTEKPTVGAFMQEWLSLYESKSGERGFFNREAAQKLIPERRRVLGYYDYGCNPCCVTGDTLILTDQGNYVIKDLVNKEVLVWNGDDFSSVMPYEVGIHPIFEVSFSDGSHLKCSSNHRFIIQNLGDVIASDLEVNMVLDNFFSAPVDNGRVKNEYGASLIITAIEECGYSEMVYCFTEPKAKRGTFNGIVTGQSEILLRSKQNCNLTEIVARPYDTLESLKEKARVAAILGTLQSTLTNFRYVSSKWKENCELERLLGVSITGICDHDVLNGSWDQKVFGLTSINSESMPTLKGWLEAIKETVIETNKEWAEKLGIPQATATTCVKPSGTVSSLVNSSSGMHERHAEYYIRTARGDVKDPLTTMLKAQGIPWEPEFGKEHDSVVFSFPTKSPHNALVRNHRTAIDQLELWKAYQLYYCEHKPSITVSVKEHEWPTTLGWVWENFDILSGVSFLPYDGGIYKQAPFQECSEATYEALEKDFPVIDFSRLGEFEFEDNTTSMQEYACVGGVCEMAS